MEGLNFRILRYINLRGTCSKRKGETWANAPGSTFLSLSNACYAGYIYLFITYLFRLYLVCSAFLYLYLLIIPLSLFLKKNLMSSKGQNDH